jgi:hypothetical protein
MKWGAYTPYGTFSHGFSFSSISVIFYFDIFVNKYIIPPGKSLSKYSNGNGKRTAEPG